MKKRRKTLILCGLLLVIAVVIFASVRMSKRGLVTVQTGQVSEMNLTSLVTATGEIKPRNYINLGANTEGPAQITAILVKEGDRVKKGQVLARLASVQPAANVSAQQAVLKSALASSAAAEASLKVSDDNIAVAKAQVKHDQVDVEQQKANFERSKALFQDKLIAQQDYQAARATYDLAVATVLQSKRRVDQAKAQRAQTAAQLSAAQVAIAQQRAMLTRSQNILSQYEAVAPLDGVMTDLPVRVGETVVPGIQNSAASTIMTIADMSLITAEVHVDETDIVGVKLGQPAAVTIDALPDQTFAGRVMEIGDTAIVRSTGVAASQSATSARRRRISRWSSRSTLRNTWSGQGSRVPRRLPPPPNRTCWRFRFRHSRFARQANCIRTNPASGWIPSRGKRRRRKCKACLWLIMAKPSSIKSRRALPARPISRFSAG